MNKTDKLSEHLTYGEAIRSECASRNKVDNTPSNEVLVSMKYTAEKIFEPVRKFVGGPVYVSSFFRTKEVNKLAGSKTEKSQHIFGQAIDMDMDIYKSKSNYEVFMWIKDNLVFDQLFWEGGENGWIHCSVTLGKNRMYVGEIPNP
jgi:hypothetical protein